VNRTTLDQVARMLAVGTSRRGVLKSALAGTAGGASALVVGGFSQAALAARLAQADSEEQSVILYEALAEQMDKHTGSCDELATKVQQFITDNADALKQIRTEEDAWDQQHRIAHATTYGDRLNNATRTLHFARVRCGYRSPSSNAPCATPVAKLAPLALPNRQDSCDCGSDCPMSTGWCVYAWAACVTGADCECCWTSYCGSYDHCMEDCQSNECCTGGEQCGSPNPPDA
jgi:hypothetical protein